MLGTINSRTRAQKIQFVLILQKVKQKSLYNVRSREEGNETGRDADDRCPSIFDMQRPTSDCEHFGGVWKRNQ